MKDFLEGLKAGNALVDSYYAPIRAKRAFDLESRKTDISQKNADTLAEQAGVEAKRVEMARLKFAAEEEQRKVENELKRRADDRAQGIYDANQPAAVAEGEARKRAAEQQVTDQDINNAERKRLVELFNTMNGIHYNSLNGKGDYDAAPDIIKAQAEFGPLLASKNPVTVAQATNAFGMLDNLYKQTGASGTQARIVAAQQKGMDFSSGLQATLKKASIRDLQVYAGKQNLDLQDDLDKDPLMKGVNIRYRMDGSIDESSMELAKKRIDAIAADMGSKAAKEREEAKVKVDDKGTTFEGSPDAVSKAMRTMAVRIGEGEVPDFRTMDEKQLKEFSKRVSFQRATNAFKFSQ